MRLDFPYKGESQDRGKSDQAPLTTDVAVNCQPVDPSNRRVRGAQRPGMDQYGSALLGGGAVFRELVDLADDNPAVTYSERANGLSVWDTKTPALLDCIAGDIDRDRALWLVDGPSSLVRINPEGREVQKVNVPVVDETQVLRAIRCSPFRELFVGTSDGVNVEDARLWAYRMTEFEDESRETELYFELAYDGDTVLGFVEQIRMGPDRSTIYTVQNNPELKRSWVVVYRNALSAAPIFASATDVPYPCHDLVVKENGQFIVCAPPDPSRNANPISFFPTTTVVEVWNPEEHLDSYEARAWCRLDPQVFLDENPDADDGDSIVRLTDSTGNGRHAFGEATPSLYLTADPVIERNALAGKPGVFFDGGTMGFGSGGNVSTNPKFPNQQRTWWPAYQGAMWAMVLVVRVPADTTIREIIGRLEAGGPSANSTIVFANRAANSGFPGGVSQGDISVHMRCDPNTVGASLRPDEGAFDQEYDFAIVTVVAPNTRQNDTYDAGFAQRGHVRINGEPVDTFSMLDATTAASIYEGLAPMSMGDVGAVAGNADAFEGYLLDMLVLREFQDDTKQAHGCVHFNANPTAGHEIRLRDGVNPEVTYRFVAIPTADTATLQEVLIAGTVQATVTAFITKVNTPTMGCTLDITASASTTHPVAGQELLKALLENDSPGNQGNQEIGLTGANFSTVKSWGMETTRVLECPLYPDVAHDPNALPTEVELLEGWAAWRFGSAQKLPDRNATWPHPYHVNAGPPTPDGDDLQSKLRSLEGIVAKFSAQGDVMWVLTGEDENPDLTTADVGGIGYGLALTEDGAGVFTVGPRKGADDSSVRRVADLGGEYSLDPQDDAWAAPLEDDATVSSPQDLLYAHPRLAVDTFGNLYVPRDTADSIAAGATNDRAALVEFLAEGAAGVGVIEFQMTLANEQRGRCAIVDTLLPNYRDDPVERAEHVYLCTENAGGRFATGSIKLVGLPVDGDTVTIDDGQGNVRVYEFDTTGAIGGDVQVDIALAVTPADATLVLTFAIHSDFLLGNILVDADGTSPSNVTRLTHTVEGPTGNQPIVVSVATPGDILAAGMTGGSSESQRSTVHKIRLVDGVGSNVPQRTRVVVGLTSAGEVRLVTTSAFGLATDGAGAFDTTARFVSAAKLFGELFIADGSRRGYKVFSLPTTADPNGVVKDFVPTGAGDPEPRCNLGAPWDGRWVLARGQGYFMSKRGDPYNWDFNPANATADQAIFDALAGVSGPSPDLIVGIHGYSDDQLIFLCSRSIHVLRGNPAQGGQVHEVMRKDGGVYGDAYARDPEGFFYWKGAERGVYLMDPGLTSWRRITRDSIERQMEDIDHATYRIKMVWDSGSEGLRVFQIPWSGVFPSTPLTGWFWDKVRDGWFRFEYDASRVPTCALELDGDDPDDRTILFGSTDGAARRLSYDAVNDDGIAVQSRFIVGPLQHSDRMFEIIVDSLSAVLARGLGGLSYHVYGSSDPDNMGSPLYSGVLSGGRNEMEPARGAGAYVWLEFYNNRPGERWALEELAINAQSGGLVGNW